MKKISYITFLLFFTTAYLLADTGNNNSFYVAQNGSDSNKGTQIAPFKTIETAIAKIRNNQKGNETYTVFVREGIYHINSTINLKGISGVTIKSFENEKVVLHGGKNIKGSNFRKITDKRVLTRLEPHAREKVWVLDLKKEGINDFGILKQRGFGSIPEPAPLELFINGNAYKLARYPNEGILGIGRIYDKGSIPRAGDFSNRGAEFGFEYERALRWKSANDIWLHGKFSNGFSDEHLQVKYIDYNKSRIKTVQPHLYGVLTSIYADKNNADEKAGLSVRGYYAYNLLEEIDQPGEYYLDRKTGKLYVYPTENLLNAHIEVSMLETPILNITKSSNVRIEDIAFTCSRGMGIFIDESENITINNCEFSNFGTVAISMGQPLMNNKQEYLADGSPKQEITLVNYSKNCTISNCVIYNTGTGGVIIDGGDRRKLLSANNVVYNTEFYKTDRINESYAPAVKLFGVGNIVRNCLFHDLKHQAIGFMGNDHIIEYCRFDNVCNDADDMGAIYSGRDQSARGTIIQYNYFSNILPKDPINTSLAGIYFDDGSGGMTIQNNLFYKVGNPGHFNTFGAFYTHGGHDLNISRNIFIDCIVGIGHSPWNSARFQRAIKSPLMIERLEKDVNIQDSVYLKRYPELKGFYSETTPRINTVHANVTINSELIRYGDVVLRSNKGYFIETVSENDFESIKVDVPLLNSFPFEKVGIQNQ